LGLRWFDHINRLITLSVILLSSFHCITVRKFNLLPFTGFTDFTGKFHLFYHFTGKR
jgi:hypothetical protein